MKYRVMAGVMLLIGVIACNAPTRPVEGTPAPLEPATSASEPTPTESVVQPTQDIELPNIQGTVDAQASATVDPDTPVQINGAIIYTSEPHPMMRVYAVRTDGQHYQYVIAGQNDGQYSLKVPAGEYYILADVNVGDGVFEGGYTETSKCLRDGGDCASAAHNLIAILAEAGQEIADIDLRDWDVPAGIFPDVPG